MRWSHLCTIILTLVLAAATARAQDPPAQPTAADKSVESALQAVFEQVEAFSAIQARVRAGVVKLSGKVPSSAIRDAAQKIAADRDGVVYVDNKLTLPEPQPDAEAAVDESPSAVDQRLAERLRKIFARFDNLNQVEVDVAAGVVELKGQVLRAEDADIAQNLAQSVDGVVFVNNRLEETTDVSERILPSVEKLTGWARDFVVALPLLLVALLVIVVFWWLGRVIAGMDRLFAKLTDKTLVQDILRQVARTLFLLLGVFLGLEILGATALVGAVLGTAGVVGLALGFAFRDIVENYLASIILSVRQPFRSKDLVEIDGHRGTVIHMTTRDTVMLTAEGNHLTLPNAKVFKSTIVNYTRAPRRRFDVAIGVGTDVDLKSATELGLGVLESMKGVVDDPEPYARVENLGDSTVTIRFYGWVDQRSTDYAKVKSAAVRLIKRVMDENHIDMPVPMYQVEVRRPNQEKARPTDAGDSTLAHADAASVDVEPERELEKQVDEELRRTEEVDLLSKEDAAED